MKPSKPRSSLRAEPGAAETVPLPVTHRDVTAWAFGEVGCELAASVFSHAREGITVTDAQARILAVNPAFTDITGYTGSEVMGRNPSVLKSGRQDSAFYAAMWRELQANDRWSGEVWNRHKNGHVYASLLSIHAIRDAGGQVLHFVGLFSDITAAKEHERQIEQMVHYDPLTRLPNRVLFADRLEQAIGQCKRRGLQLAVAYLDLDGFKAVNEQHGHDVGDELLVIMARRLQAALRDGGTLARIGGDEFAAIVVDLVDARECEPVLHRLLHATAEPVRIGSHTMRISASIGVTLYPQDAADAELLLRHADQAMYQAKLAGRNRVHLFDVLHHEEVTTRRETLNQIRRALERGDFVLHYQPKVNLRTGTIVGVEALIRWQHPERGLLSPAAFLPVIEDHPVSLELGDWVIGQALSQMVEWRVQGLSMPISVNVSAPHLQHADFVPRLAQRVADHPLVEPGWLELEVLETSALDDVSKVLQAMHDCRALGVRFALDDFGTGYSTLTYLSKLPAELLKIDQSFVRDMLSDPGNCAIVEGVIGLARAFRRQVIAEGVESAAHGRALLGLGCELAQGYGIARPMPAAAVAGWAARWRPEAAWA